MEVDHDHLGHVLAVRRAAADLVRERFVLEEDAARFISDAQARSALK